MRAVRVVIVLTLAVAIASAAWSWLRRGPAEGRLPHMRVEVLNGSTESLLAQRVAQRLQAAGHEVVAVGNAERHDFARSFGIDRRGKVRWTRRFTDRFGPMPLIQERRPDAGADLTIVLGADWERLAILADQGPGHSLRD